MAAFIQFMIHQLANHHIPEIRGIRTSCWSYISASLNAHACISFKASKLTARAAFFQKVGICYKTTHHIGVWLK